MDSFEKELEVAGCFGLEKKYLNGELNENDCWKLAEVGQWAESKYDNRREMTRAELVKAIDQRLPQVGLRFQDDKLTRFRKFHNSTVCECGLIAEEEPAEKTIEAMERSKKQEEERGQYLRDRGASF